MALEDDFCDIVRKARFGLDLSLGDVAARAGLDPARLEALEAGKAPEDAEAQALAGALSLRAAPLAAIAAGRYAPPPVPTSFGAFEVRAVFVERVSAYAYALRTPEGGVLVDCGGAVERLLEALGGDLKGVLLTHGHHDHVEGLGELGARAPVYAHPLLAQRIPGARPLRDGEEVLGLRSLYSPGHNQDMLTILGPGFAFVGDTLFAGSLGRAEGPAHYPRLLQSASRILRLPEETALFCGHGPATRVDAERQHNAFPVS